MADTTEFQHALSGHGTLLQAGDTQLCKTNLSAAAAAWWSMFTPAAADDLPQPLVQLAAYVPRPSAVSDTSVTFEDMTRGSSGSCAALDLKIGTREYGPHPATVSVEKKVIQMAKAAASSSGATGVRVVGARFPESPYALRMASPEQDAWIRVGKAPGRAAVSLDEIRSGPVDAFLACASGPQIRALRADLAGIRAALDAAVGLRLYSSSLLFVYDTTDPDYAAVRLIDFAHVLFSQGQATVQGPDTDAIAALDAALALFHPTAPGFNVQTGSRTWIHPASHIPTAVTDLVNAVYSVAEAGLWLPGFARTSLDEITGLVDRADDPTRSSLLLVARSTEPEPVLLGVVACHVVPHPEAGSAAVADDAVVGEFGMLAVAPSAQSSGVGLALVRAAEDTARSVWGVDTMMLELLCPRDWTSENKARMAAWYQRLGYVPGVAMDFAARLPHLAPKLATPTTFTVYLKPLSSAPSAGSAPSSNSS